MRVARPARLIRPLPAVQQFLAGREVAAEFATSLTFYTDLLRIFRAVVPMVCFLNAPLRTPDKPFDTASIR